MKRRYRLLKKAEFQNVLKKGSRTYSKNFVCYHIEYLELKNVKIGIIIPKKKCRLSIRRKYLKRLFWAFNSRDRLDLFPKVKCVIMYRDFFYNNYSSGQLNFENLKGEYIRLMENLKNRRK